MAYGTKQLTKEGVEINLVALKTNIEDVDISAYETVLVVDVPKNDFTDSFRYRDTFSDVFNLAETKASLDRGVLTILVPYKASAKPKKIIVNE